MRTQFFSRNVWIGVLMSLVLTFSVQGVCEALTITQTSSPVESKPSGSSFDLTFTVRLTGNTVANHPDYPRRRVNADHANTGTPTYQYIDNQGYEVAYISETSTTSYRTLTTDPTAPTGGTFVVDPRPSYSTKSDGTAADPAAAGSPTTPYLVNTSGRLYDSMGKAVYIQTGTGSRTSDPVSPWSYKDATGYSPKPISEGADASALHDYNDEAIGITISPARSNSVTGTLELKSRGFMLPSVTKPSDEASYNGGVATYSLRERVDIGLPTSITLVFKGASVGTHMIEIWDATPTTDFPLVGGPSANRPRSSKTFTIHVTPSTITTVPDTADITPDNRRIPVVTDEPQQVNKIFTFPTDGNYRILYQVFRGNGILYIGTREEEFKTPPPGQTLLVHQDSDVWIKMNGTSNEVHLSFANEDRSTARARVVYEYKGRDLPGRNTGDTSGTGTTNQPPQTQTPSLSISVSGTGTTRSVTVTATNAQGATVPGLAVTLSGSALATSQTVTSGTPTTITIPSAPGTYTLQAVAGGYTVGTWSTTITAPGRLALALIGAQVNGSQTVQVTARNAGGSLETTAVLVTLSGAGISRTVTVTGSQNVPIPLPTTSGTLTASATGYTSGSVTLPARSTTPTTTATTTTTTTTTTTGTSGEADSIEIDGSRSISGTVNQATRLRVRVLDANDRGVSGVRVTFRVLAPGKGRLSQRGNGRATQVNTDRSGYATASLTPLGGDLIVEAKAARVSSPVSFIIDVDGSAGDTSASTTGDTTSPQTYNVRDEISISLEGTLTFSGSRTLNGITYTCVGSGECVVSFGTVVKGQIQAAPAKTTPQQEYKVRDEIPISLEGTLTFRGQHAVNGTIYTCVGSGECVVSYGTVVKGEIRVSAATATSTPRTTDINPEVLLDADRRPPMVWVDGGGIYTLIGTHVQTFAVGPINSVQREVQNAVDIAIHGNKVYWTEQIGANEGTINSANLDGSGAKRLVEIRALPRGIAVDAVAKRLYWTNSQGWIQSSNLEGTARKNVISGGLEDPRGIAVSEGWVYWTQGNGRIQAVNLTGTQALRNIATAPDIANDVAVFEGKVYWTEQTGRNAGTINSVNLDGTGAKALVSIQALPRGITVDPAAERLYWTNSQGWIQSSNLQGTGRRNVAKGLGNPIGIALSANIKAPVAKSTPPKSTTPAANYDVDGNGSVDNADVFLVALAVGTSNATYDVNGDGTVNDKDIALVRDNRDDGAAGAPMIVGMKLSADQIGRLQAQIDLLVVSGDRSPATLKTLVYLQQLIATARPEQTQLLANFPNPFNPETWIPYELATDTDVRITIYTSTGVVVRTLLLGQQSAGYYTDRERAAYWDGKNTQGEQVASGVYFYQLETDAMSALRKMVILK